MKGMLRATWLLLLLCASQAHAATAQEQDA